MLPNWVDWILQSSVGFTDCNVVPSSPVQCILSSCDEMSLLYDAVVKCFQSWFKIDLRSNLYWEGRNCIEKVGGNFGKKNFRFWVSFMKLSSFFLKYVLLTTCTF